jgi:hypothetical protein
MLEGFKKWWREATGRPTGTGRIGFVHWSGFYYKSPRSQNVPTDGIAKAVELERLGRKSKMQILDGPAAFTTGWVNTDCDVEWIDDY